MKFLGLRPSAQRVPADSGRVPFSSFTQFRFRWVTFGEDGLMVSKFRLVLTDPLRQ